MITDLDLIDWDLQLVSEQDQCQLNFECAAKGVRLAVECVWLDVCCQECTARSVRLSVLSSVQSGVLSSVRLGVLSSARSGVLLSVRLL